MATGKVWLIGAGPGDLELLTLKAVRYLGQADILLVDDLVNPEITKFAPQAKVIYVGKRGGCKSTPQAFILRLMRRYARQGKQVARVKGGEPLLFGRAGEEISFLQADGIPVEIVNGITSAAAAAASVSASLTYRGHAHGITFITAHLQDDTEPDWPTLAGSGCTLAIYMGLNRVRHICEQLQTVLPASTPAVAVSGATTLYEQRLVSTIGQLADDIAQHKLPSPTVILVGEAMQFAVSQPASGLLVAQTLRQAF
ncbi:uroporphyrinogen-III C-methyltransferase [Leeia oryzae]|uniref:uroporphyrinogen-III C-methyltransferase n=1 Tax=Leeia oryzae TaxID=356662 RepID=UPI0003626374|nr:uroporphyrinogen-III C-methyltransferase [Leeia oryzae]